MTTTNYARLNNEFHNSLFTLNSCTILSLIMEKAKTGHSILIQRFFIKYFTMQWAGTKQSMQRGQLCLPIYVLQVTSILSIFIWLMDLSFSGELFKRRRKRASFAESIVK